MIQLSESIRKKCQYLGLSHKNRCKTTSFAPIKVNLIHSDTGRKSKQTWHLCKKHFNIFMNTQGEGWEAVYLKKPNKRAIVTGYQILDSL